MNGRWAVIVIAVAAMIGGCASGGPERAVDTNGEVIINPERTRAGNPPVYKVFGETYYVQNSSADYRERGVASWYGKDFHGRSTANGETYDMYALTAAHKTLPIPTWVEVTNLTNGRRVIVKVNDRGPFVAGRIIDLSYTAAAELGMVDAGTARVEVRALGAPVGGDLPASRSFANRSGESPRSGFSLISEAAAAEPGPGDRPMHQVFAQAGAFSDRDNATKLVSRLKAGGQKNVFMVSQTDGPIELHRVRIGPLVNVAAFDDVARELVALGVRDSLLVLVN